MPSRSSSSHTATAALEDQTLINEPNDPPDTSEHQSEDQEENRERSVSVHQFSVQGDESPPSSIEPSIDGFEEPPPSHRRHHPQSCYHDNDERTSRRYPTEQPSEYHDYVHDRDHARDGDRERGRGQRHRKRRSSTKDDEYHSRYTRSSKKPTILYDNGRTKLTTEKFTRITSLPPGCDKVEIVTIHTNHKGGRETRFKRYKYEGQSWIPGRTRDPKARSESPERSRRRKTRRTNDGYTDKDWGNETYNRTEEHRQSRSRSRSRSRSTTPQPAYWESRPDTTRRERSPSVSRVNKEDRSRERSIHGQRRRGHSHHHRDDPPDTQATSRSKHRSSKSRPDRETRGHGHSRHHRDDPPDTQPSSRSRHRSSKSRPSGRPSGPGKSHIHRTRQRRTTYTVVPQGSSACVIL